MLHLASATRASSTCAAPCRQAGAIGRASVAAGAGKQQEGEDAEQASRVTYGKTWYEETREEGGIGGKRGRTVREEIEYRRAANSAANNGKERKDLYTDNWDGSEYKGGDNNILTWVIALFFLVPVLGLGFAYWSYGTLWG